MIVLCTGSRQWTDKSVVYVALAMFRDIYPVEVFHGGAAGADSLVEDVCREYQIPTRLFLPGPYRGRGKPAPLARNDAMLDELVPDRDLVVAFMLGRPERGGTRYTVEGARDRRLRVVVWNWPGDGDYRDPVDALIAEGQVRDERASTLPLEVGRSNHHWLHAGLLHRQAQARR